jgi:putative ABC transport system permease protein
MNRGILLGQGTPFPVQTAMASHELFPLLGIKPFVGRAFTAYEEHEKKRVAILSERLWRDHYGADPGIVGRSVRLEQTVFTVVGVVEDRWAFPAWADLWMPLSLLEPELPGTRKYHPLEVIARLRKEVSEGTAQEELRSLMGTLAEQFPATNGGESAMLIPMQNYLTGPLRGALLLVWAAVSLVLLMVSVNVAHLVLARTAGRERELAIRVALGATRAHIGRLLLTENLLLAACGGTAGVGLAALLMPAASRYASSQLPRFERLTLDSNIAAFSFFISLITMVIFCLPALWSSLRPSIRPAMEAARRTGIYRVLIVAEVALAFVVLGGAGLLMGSFERLMAVDPGFETSGRIVMQVILPQPAYDWDKSQRWFEQRLAPRMRSIPGVRSVANSNLLPLSLPNSDQIHRFATRFGVPGETYADGVFPVAQTRWVSEDYFRTMGIRLMRGRLLTEADRGLQRYVVNETLARRYFRGQDVVGKQIIFGVADPRQVAVQIVGVVKDVRDLSLELPPEPTIYSLNTSMQFALLVDGTGIKTEALVATVRELEPDAVVERAGSMEHVIGDSLARRRFSLTLMTAFGTIAVLLASLGVFGVVSYAAGRRVREFGLRMALGARPCDVRRLILAETAAIAAVGVIAGASLSQVLVPLSRSLLYDTQPWDPLAWVTSASVLFASSLIASWIPARRASRLDPSTALRSE